MEAAPEPTPRHDPLSEPDLERMREESRRAIERTRAGLERIESMLRSRGAPGLALRPHELASAQASRRVEMPPELRGRPDPADASDPLDGAPRAN